MPRQPLTNHKPLMTVKLEATLNSHCEDLPSPRLQHEWQCTKDFSFFSCEFTRPVDSRLNSSCSLCVKPQFDYILVVLLLKLFHSVTQALSFADCITQITTTIVAAHIITHNLTSFTVFNTTKKRQEAHTRSGYSCKTSGLQTQQTNVNSQLTGRRRNSYTCIISFTIHW